jgi:hypothetical protein
MANSTIFLQDPSKRAIFTPFIVANQDENLTGATFVSKVQSLNNIALCFFQVFNYNLATSIAIKMTTQAIKSSDERRERINESLREIAKKAIQDTDLIEKMLKEQKLETRFFKEVIINR